MHFDQSSRYVEDWIQAFEQLLRGCATNGDGRFSVKLCKWTSLYVFRNFFRDIQQSEIYLYDYQDYFHGCDQRVFGDESRSPVSHGLYSPALTFKPNFYSFLAV